MVDKIESAVDYKIGLVNDIKMMIITELNNDFVIWLAWSYWFSANWQFHVTDCINTEQAVQLGGW